MGSDVDSGKYTFNFAGAKGFLSSQLEFYNAGDNFYYAVWVNNNRVLLSVSTDKAKKFVGPEVILDINYLLEDIQFLAEKEKFVVAITEKAPDSTIIRAAYGSFDSQSDKIISKECPKRHVITKGLVLNVQLLFVDYKAGISEEHVFVNTEDDEIEEETGRHP
jgi:hypothetical protein